MQFEFKIKTFQSRIVELKHHVDSLKSTSKQWSANVFLQKNFIAIQKCCMFPCELSHKHMCIRIWNKL